MGPDVWLVRTETDVGGQEHESFPATSEAITATIFRGPMQLPKGKECKVYDITGKVVSPYELRSGIYFITIAGILTQKVVKVRSRINIVEQR